MGNKKLSEMVHMKPLLLLGANGLGDRVPSLLNGGLDTVSPFYWGAVLALASGIEIYTLRLQRDMTEAGDIGFDPLGLYPSDKVGQKRMQLAEIKHGRVAMIATTL